MQSLRIGTRRPEELQLWWEANGERAQRVGAYAASMTVICSLIWMYMPGSNPPEVEHYALTPARSVSQMQMMALKYNALEQKETVLTEKLAGAERQCRAIQKRYPALDGHLSYLKNPKWRATVRYMSSILAERSIIAQKVAQLSDELEKTPGFSDACQLQGEHGPREMVCRS